MPSANRMIVAGPGQNAVIAAEKDDIDVMMRRLLNQEQGELKPVETAVEVARPRRDFDTACELLERASQAFDLLLNRCQHLQGELDAVGVRAQAQADDNAATVDRWKRLAADLKAQLDAAEQSVAGLKARADAAEARAAMAESRASALERASAQAAGHAAMAESLSTKLHDKVVSAFGIGSRAHPVLEAVVTKAAAE